jgi:hypothetical protein
MIKTYEKEKSLLYELNSRKKLCEIFKVSDYKILEKLALDDSNYNVFEIKNKNKSTKRKIEEPLKHLKKFHKDFNRLLQRIIVPEFVKAGIKGSCYIKNAQVHKDGKFFFTTDIKQFFPSSKQEKVFQFLLYEMKMSKDIAFLVSNILCYDSHLPTGSPSSLLLTYWTYRKPFQDIYDRATNLGIKMTLYVDDLTFSANKPISKDFKKYVRERLSTENLKVNKAKTKSLGAKAHKKVTGATITPNGKVVVTNKLRHKIHQLRSKENPDSKEVESLKGMLNSARQIEPDFLDSYYKELMQT